MKFPSVRHIAALSLFALLLLPKGAFGAIYFTEGFESAWSNAPGGWTYANNGAPWYASTGTTFWWNYNYATPHGGSYMAFQDNYSYSSGSYARMISPTINLSTSTQSRLSFWYMRDEWPGYNAALTITISSDNGTNWTTLATITSPSAQSWSQVYYPIPAAFRTTTFKVAIQGTSDWYNPFCVDDLVVDDGSIPTCSAAVTYPYYMGIGNVAISTLNNSSTCTYNGTGYQDFTTLPMPTLLAGLSYNLTVAGCANTYDQYAIAFFDWNHNNVLGESGESFYLGVLSYSGTSITMSIPVPVAAAAGPTLMRIRTDYYYQSIPGPCGFSYYGETEDYMVNVVPNNNAIVTTPTSLTFTAEQTGPLPATKPLSLTTLTNNLPASFAWTSALTQTPAWFSINPTSGTGAATVTTTVTTTAIAPATYNGTITFQSPVSAPKSVPVTYNLIPRVQIATSANPMVVKLGCAPGGNYTKSVQITNIGGHFANGLMMWTATTLNMDVTILTPSGVEGGNLNFTVNTTGMQPGNTYYRTITINAYNSATNISASNGPFALQIAIEFEPALPVTQTKPVGVGTYTSFTNSLGGVVADVMSNSGAISTFTVNMTPCTMPTGFTRLRYVRRLFQFSHNATNPNVTIKFYYTAGEAYPMVTNPASLRVWQQPIANGAWVLRGGTSNPNLNHVQATITTGLNGTFALAQPWFPKPMTLALTSMYDRVSRNVVLQWNTDIAVDADGFTVERMKGDDPETGMWEVVGSVSPNTSGRYGYAERVTEEGTYQYRLIAIDRDGTDRESRPFAVNVSNSPLDFAIEQNYPNPFNPSTSIRFSIPQTVQVSVKVFDMMWREVATLVNEVKTAGSYDVTFDASNLPSGAYFYRMEAGSFSATKKMSLMK